MDKIFFNSNIKKLGERIFAFFFKLRYVFYVISVILLLLAIRSAYDTFIEGAVAEKNAQISLEQFEQILLKTDIDLVEKPTEDVEEILIEVVATEVESETTDVPTSIKEVKQEISYTPIAKLNIEKLDLNVTVLSEWSYALLDVSVNKFYGPDPNEPGNFIIIGHNFKNNAHFGSLDLLEIGDRINLTDLTGRTNTFEVYEILIIKPNEVEKLNSNEIMALTLVTCDTDNTYRLVVKSKLVVAK